MFIHSAVIFIAESRNIENKFIEDYCIDWRIYQRLSKGNCNRGLLVAFRGQFSDTAFVYQLRPTLLQWRWSHLKLIKLYVVKKGTISMLSAASSSVSKIFLGRIWSDGAVVITNVNVICTQSAMKGERFSEGMWRTTMIKTVTPAWTDRY